MPVPTGVTKRVVSGDKVIASLFTAEQEAFLADLSGGRRMDFTKLAVLGPLEAQC